MAVFPVPNPARPETKPPASAPKIIRVNCSFPMAPKSYSPMTRRPYRIETVLGHQSFGRRPGEVGHPAREPPAMLGQIRRTHANNPRTLRSGGSPATTRRPRHRRAGMVLDGRVLLV
jgi:hypothetical protein